MKTLAQGNDERDEKDAEVAETISPPAPAGLDSEAWSKTDRPLRFPVRHKDRSRARALADQLARTLWLADHDVHTELVDAGIGCCWFAQQGDSDPVSGQTEDEAITRLAEQNGLPWHGAGRR